jgi:hypothetical protein
MEKSGDARATCLNCIDGRVQLPVLKWILKQYKIDFVDVVTAAGMDRLLYSGDTINEILRSVKISINTNKSTRLFVVAHYDCRGNPVDKSTHRRFVIKSIKRLKAYWPKIAIIGLWVDSRWQVEILCKSSC